MTATPPPRRSARPSRAVIRRRRLVVGIIAVLATALVVVLGITGVHALMSGTGGAQAGGGDQGASTPTPEPTPDTPAQALLKTSTDPNACAVSFQIDGATVDPQLQTEGKLLTGLPIPKRDGSVFAGWYATAQDATALTQTARVNGSKITTCQDKQLTLHGAWMTPDQNTAAATKVPILMYHQFTTNPQGEDNWLKANYSYINDFDATMAHIAQGAFYLPTWDELNAFIDGQLYIPPHSVIITDDDADPTWLSLAVPVVDKYKLLTTSFVITADRQAPTPSVYVLQRSHTDSMHTAGDNGKGRMVNWSADQIAADLEKSAQILGAKEVIAYPYGHYNATAEQGVTQAGFQLARTIDWGYVSIGTNKLELPVIRVNYGDTVTDIARNID